MLAEVFSILFGFGFIFIVFVLFLFSGLKVINQYERGIKFTLGRFSGIMHPGLNFVMPIFQAYQKVDIRVTVVDVPDQDAITKDNVTVKVNAVLYYKVIGAKEAILEVEDYHTAISQLAQTTMRDVVGEAELDQLLANRDAVSSRIQALVDKSSDPWGIKVHSVDLKHIELPSSMVRTMAKAAEADREKKAVIIKAEGEVMAAKNMAHAAKMLSASPGALHLRTLQSLNDLSSDQSNTVVFALPLEIIRGFGAKR
ncbi:slipin family protein [archaeon]|jgi:regulator of protease activity HflC (stomatin/prohibitin superfamily)|nr:slipin family protein [archaeon]MBT4022952.1 slipin family protein [archaeon]MBT4271943.1 slipin family protein [archaeon]MBT4461781.1 slipin family protein [archaeon]MBT4858204.1 slipin family protein [archaeon]